MFYGGSHALRLYQSAKMNKHLKGYSVINKTKSGYNFEICTFPREIRNLKSTDMLCIQVFGNDLLQKHFYIEKVNGKKCIHLTKFVPKGQKILDKLYDDLFSLLITLKCRVIFVNLISRVACCPHHYHKGIQSFYKIQKNIIKKKFEQFEVFDPDPIAKKLRVDAVHLMRFQYDKIVELVVNRKGLQ